MSSEFGGFIPASSRTRLAISWSVHAVSPLIPSPPTTRPPEYSATPPPNVMMPPAISPLPPPSPLGGARNSGLKRLDWFRPHSECPGWVKAYTANAFSLDVLALSTAMLYTFTQPGHSLWGLIQSNLFNPEFLAPPSGEGGGKGEIAGGIITFGGGVALYSGGRVVGGLGISGDTACTDHDIAKRVRDEAGMNPPNSDDISYSSVDGPSVFSHPLCPNTFRNGVFIGNEPNASGY